MASRPTGSDGSVGHFHGCVLFCNIVLRLNLIKVMEKKQMDERYMSKYVVNFMSRIIDPDIYDGVSAY